MYIWSLPLFLTELAPQTLVISWLLGVMAASYTELLHLLEFPGDGSIFCPNEVTLGGLLDGSWSLKDSHD